MSDTPRRRRLVAILMADVAGFSRLMARDEEGTTARILEFHHEVGEAVRRHGGRVVATAGDSVFGDFDSIVEALDCAESIQKSLHKSNEGIEDDHRIQARIGLHLGDVIVDGDNMFGDGVNIAARLEQLADPGGVMLSDAVYQQVKARSVLPIEPVGRRDLKNIDEPVEVYRIPPEAFTGEYVPAERPAPRKRPSSGDALRDTLRDAIQDIAAEVKEAVRESREAGVLPPEAAEIPQIPDEEPVRQVEVPFGPGVFVLATLGALGILARATGWSDNGLYPFLGCWLFGIVAGQVAKRLSHRRGISFMFGAVGLAVGAFFLGSTLFKALSWVMAGAIFGAGIRGMAGGEEP